MLRWLRFLATQMQQHQQTVFFLEQLQPDWLADRRSRLLYQLVVGLDFWLVGGQLGKLVSGLVVWQVGGLGAFLQHFALRIFLWGAGSLPWNVVAFLDEAAERLLLRKVGGGYIFMHRLLLDYFASLEKKES